jgi:hypothetical protein
VIARRLEQLKLTTWRYKGLATAYVALAVSSLLVKIVADAPTVLDTLVIPLAFYALLLLPLIAIQRYANAASLDPTGSANSAISLGNVFWVVVGTVQWTFLVYLAWLLPWGF